MVKLYEKITIMSEENQLGSEALFNEISGILAVDLCDKFSLTYRHQPLAVSKRIDVYRNFQQFFSPVSMTRPKNAFSTTTGGNSSLPRKHGRTIARKSSLTTGPRWSLGQCYGFAGLHVERTRLGSRRSVSTSLRDSCWRNTLTLPTPSVNGSQAKT